MEDESKVDLISSLRGFCDRQFAPRRTLLTLILREFTRLLRADLPLIAEIALVADEDDGDFLIRVVAHLLQPFAYRFECRASRDVVDQ